MLTAFKCWIQIEQVSLRSESLLNSIMKRFRLQFFVVFVALITISSCGESDQTPRSSTVLYFADWSGMQVGVIDVARPNKYSVIANEAKDNLGEISAVAVDLKNQVVYITEQGNSRILRKNLNGTGALVELYTAEDGVESPVAIELDSINERIYWLDQSKGKVMWGSLNGSSVPDSITFENSDKLELALYGFGIDVKANKIYIADSMLGILVGDLDGSSPLQALYSVGDANVSRPTNLTVDVEGGKLYWVDETTQKILVAPVDGSLSPEVLIDIGPTNTPIAVAIDKIANRIYWSEFPSDEIAYRSLDGKGPTTVLLKGVRSFCLRLDNSSGK